MAKAETNAHRQLADYQAEWTVDRLKQLRYLSALSLADVEERVGMKGPAIARMESGRISSSLANIAILLSAYGVSLADFFALCPTALPKKKPAPQLESPIAVMIGDERDKEKHRFAKYMCERYPQLSTAKMDAHILQVLRNSEAAKAKKKKT